MHSPETTLSSRSSLFRRERRNGARRATDTAKPASVTVVVPTLNEERNLPMVLARVPAEYECIVVDGHSKDDSVQAARTARPDALVMRQTGTGKGNALLDGIKHATGEIIVLLDADGSTEPAEIPRFVEALQTGADFATGSRFMGGGGSADITRVRRLGNAILTGLVNLLYGTNYTDITYGYNAFWAHQVPRFGDLSSKGFEIEVLLNLRAAKEGLRVTEVPSFESCRVHGTSNLSAARDGRLILDTIVRERLRPG
jgi:glycosyltransferase involved in cell wall biosynthesis